MCIVGAAALFGESQVGARSPDATSRWSRFSLPNFSLSVALVLGMFWLHLVLAAGARFRPAREFLPGMRPGNLIPGHACNRLSVSLVGSPKLSILGGWQG